MRKQRIKIYKRRINKVDEDAGQYMQHAEHKYRKIKSGRITFSPEASKWLTHCQVYRSLL